ncbi:MAG: hypothetical protein JJU34_21590 [Lunatimonas sp.]|uniref:DUF6090 family protein n=1 Tax=Lunatimonas sp. TaxID=2060141 RepID=UPI00263B589A|nr:DUF6090 family protein [Lunatimonas sp.]MCC5939887.1 hypothetical protein [Lunatimonas sp.]
MIKFFRKIRFNLLEENKIVKYLKYAVGEIVLVVIGILIAIQINNSNQKRLNAEALEGYLNSIANNIQSDLQKAEKFTQKRLELFPRVSAIRQQMSPEYQKIMSEVYGENLNAESRYSAQNLSFIAQTINGVWSSIYLTPNLSGFESLKSSGFLSQLQGTDLEQLLFDYYNLLDELTILENNYNSGIQRSFDDFINADLPGTFALFSQGTRDWNTELKGQLPAMVDEILEHPTLIPVFFWPYELIVKYENLIVRGQALHEMIVTGKKAFNEEINQQLVQIFDEYGSVPYPKIIRNGYNTHYYNSAVASPNNNQGVNMQFLGSHIALQFSAEPWAAAYWFVGSGVPDSNRVKDFSNFQTLRLKLRGILGGEKVDIGLKDKSDPTDGSETKIPLTLTNEWHTYDIPLTSFAPTRLEELFVVASIVVENRAYTIEIESMEFL